MQEVRLVRLLQNQQPEQQLHMRTTFHPFNYQLGLRLVENNRRKTC